MLGLYTRFVLLFPMIPHILTHYGYHTINKIWAVLKLLQFNWYNLELKEKDKMRYNY